MTMTDDDTLDLTAQIVSAHVSHNSVTVDELPRLIAGVRRALACASEGAQPKPTHSPAVPLEQSVKPEHIVCLECGKRMRLLKRHIATEHDLAPDEYRDKWGLPGSYPMTAPSYSKVRSGLAKEFGLGLRARSSEG